MSFAVLFLFFFGIKACVFDKHGQSDDTGSETSSSSTADSSSAPGAGSTGSTGNASAGSDAGSTDTNTADTSTTWPTSRTQAGAEAAQILESGYFITRKGNVKYGVVWQNPNGGCSIYGPTLLVVGKDAEGNALFSDTVVRPVKMRPGERQILAGSVLENNTALQSVEFSVVEGNSSYIAGEAPAQDYLSITNLQESDSDAYSKLFTCTLAVNTLPEDADGYIFYDVILRDAQGKIVFGDLAVNSGAGTSGAKLPAGEGESAECEFKVGTPDLFGGVPEHASFEVGATLGCDLVASKK